MSEDASLVANQQVKFTKEKKKGPHSSDTGARVQLVSVDANANVVVDGAAVEADVVVNEAYDADVNGAAEAGQDSEILGEEEDVFMADASGQVFGGMAHGDPVEEGGALEADDHQQVAVQMDEGYGNI